MSSSTTTKTFNMSSVPATEPSICIPRVFPNIGKDRVIDTFEEVFGPGCVERVDMVKRENAKGEKFSRVFVHFKEWPETETGNAVRQRLLKGESIKIVYDDPWFWKCSASRVPKPEDRKRLSKDQGRGAKRAPFVDMSADSGEEVHSPKKMTVVKKAPGAPRKAGNDPVLDDDQESVTSSRSSGPVPTMGAVEASKDLCGNM